MGARKTVSIVAIRQPGAQRWMTGGEVDHVRLRPFGAQIVRDGFQVGIGANDKNGLLGASVWLDIGGQNWDINVNLAQVPAPASLALFGLGLIGLGMVRRRTA